MSWPSRRSPSPTWAVTLFQTGPNAITTNFNPGDIGYIKRSIGHYVKNVGDTDLVFLEVFRADRFQDVSLSDWLTHTPSQMVTANTNLPADVLSRFPKGSPGVVPV